jgi:lipid A 3-O-deacylase
LKNIRAVRSRSLSRLIFQAASALALLLVSVSIAAAQTESTTPASAATTTTSDDYVHFSLERGKVNLGFLAGGGTGLGKSDNTQFLYAGGRIGLVLTHDHLPWLLRGNFEWDFDVLPMYPVFPPNGGVWGGSIRPVIWKWNFTHGRKIAPYFAAEGGIVFTRNNVPPGDTSQVNFTPGAAFGANFFTKNRRSFFFEGNLGHLSSASLGNHNPGYNVTFLVTAGFSFFKR